MLCRFHDIAGRLGGGAGLDFGAADRHLNDALVDICSSRPGASVTLRSSTRMIMRLQLVRADRSPSIISFAQPAT